MLRPAVLASLAVSLLMSACEPTPVVGAACMYPSDCRRPLTCRFERCRTECVLNRDCPAGATCLLEADGASGTCGVTQDVGCEDGVECDANLACIADRCVARCRDATDCPEDGVCAAVTGTTTRVCFDERGEIPDAEIPDAGASDTGVADGGTDASQSDAGPAITTIEMCVGENGMCALTSDGRVYCWGGGNNGRIGHADELDSITPIAVLDRNGDPLAGIDHIACGSSFGCAHRRDGRVLCWGDGSNGELGGGAMVRLWADDVPDDDPFGLVEAVGGRLSAAGYHVCVLDDTDGTRSILTCWGDNSGLIDVSRPFMSNDPLPPQSPLGTGAGDDVVQIAVSAGGACVLHRTAAVSCWGQNDHGEASVSPFTVLPELEGLTPVPIPGPGAVSLVVGWFHRAVRAQGGSTVLSWGANGSGQLGTFGASDTATPTPLPAGTPAFTRIASDGLSNTTCGVISGAGADVPGRVRCWGDNNVGQAGLRSSSSSVGPRDDVIVEATGLPLDAVERVFVGPRNGCAATLSGELWCWGQNSVGQLGLVPDDILRAAVPVAIPDP